METVSDRSRNPFGMRPRCSTGEAVCGYGDPNGDFHVIGDHPGVHGGSDTGIPFTGSVAGKRLQRVLRDVGLLERTGRRPAVSNVFMNYIHPCPPTDGADPTDASYAEQDRFFDAELRAVNAHILLPVGRHPTDRVLAGFTTRVHKVPRSMRERHASEVRGRGFLVVPVRAPERWSLADREALTETLDAILSSDYRQTKGVATRIG